MVGADRPRAQPWQAAQKPRTKAHSCLRSGEEGALRGVRRDDEDSLAECELPPNLAGVGPKLGE